MNWQAFMNNVHRASQTEYVSFSLRVNENYLVVNTLDAHNPFLLRGCNLNDSIDKVIKSLFVTTNIIQT